MHERYCGKTVKYSILHYGIIIHFIVSSFFKNETRPLFPPLNRSDDEMLQFIVKQKPLGWLFVTRHLPCAAAPVNVLHCFIPSQGCSATASDTHMMISLAPVALPLKWHRSVGNESWVKERCRVISRHRKPGSRPCSWIPCGFILQFQYYWMCFSKYT